MSLKKRSILHLIQKPQNRGAETFACQLANHQVSFGHEVKLISIFPGVADLPWTQEIPSLNGNSKNRLVDYAAWKKLAEHINEFNPDIIQANAGDTLKYAVLSKMIFGWKTPIVFRNASEVGRYLSSLMQKRFNKFLYKRVQGIASVSKASEMDLVNHFPFLKGRTVVIPVGLEEIENIDPITLKPEGGKHIVHVGGFSFEKNHKSLISMFQRILNDDPDVHLHLLGDGPLREEIEEIVQEKSLQQKVTFYGFVTNPLKFIRAADLLVLPSIIEGLPGVLLESMYCKTPVVAYDVGGISEIVTPETGKLIPKNDESAFVEAIFESLNNKNEDQVTRAYTQVREHYMNREIASSFMNFYNMFSRT